MSSDETRGSQVPEQLVEQLVRGYDALAVELKRIHEQHKELENKLSWAKQQYLDALKRFTPNSSSKDFHDFLGELDEAGACEKEGDSDWLVQLSNSSDEEKRTRAYNIRAAAAARGKIDYCRKLREVTNVNDVRIWAGKSADPAEMERDFTTSGTPSGLGCPFAAGKLLVRADGNHRGVSTPRSSLSRMSLGRRSRKASFHDPIRAEECESSPMSPEKSIAGSIPLCPIRFLDQHSPEEVARYFEKHQHEVPRSHEFCVKRFQDNDDKVKDLNSKYANVVTMVQGLKKLHQPLLPKPQDIAIDMEDDDDGDVHISSSKVESWARAISASDEAVGEAPTSDDGERETRFDRSLKDVRVGESPSRPWGIPVPDDFPKNGDGLAKKSDVTASPMESDGDHDVVEAAPPSHLKCPFSGMKETDGFVNPHAAPALSPRPEQSPSPASRISAAQFMPVPNHVDPASNSVPQMIFNGPVFFGYTPDQAMSVLKQAGFAP